MSSICRVLRFVGCGGFVLKFGIAKFAPTMKTGFRFIGNSFPITTSKEGFCHNQDTNRINGLSKC